MGNMIDQLTAQLALQACEEIMVERLNAQFPKRQHLSRWLKSVPETYDPAVNLFRPKVQRRNDSHKAKFCKEIEQIQASLDMLGKTPRELAGLIDRAFACIAINPGLTLANVSERLPLLWCQYSNVFESCNLACTDESGSTVCLAGEDDRHMPWQCWHPHYWQAPLYILFDLAVDYLNDKRCDHALVRDVTDTSIFLRSLNAVFSSQCVINKSDTVNTKGSIVVHTVPIGTSAPPPPPEPSEQDKKDEHGKLSHILAKEKYVAVIIVLIMEYRKHRNISGYKGLSAKDMCGKISNGDFFLELKSGAVSPTTLIINPSEIVSIIHVLRKLIKISRMPWKIKSYGYRLVGEGDIDNFERNIIELIDNINRQS